MGIWMQREVLIMRNKNKQHQGYIERKYWEEPSNWNIEYCAVPIILGEEGTNTFCPGPASIKIFSTKWTKWKLQVLLFISMLISRRSFMIIPKHCRSSPCWRVSGSVYSSLRYISHGISAYTWTKTNTTNLPHLTIPDRCRGYNLWNASPHQLYPQTTPSSPPPYQTISHPGDSTIFSSSIPVVTVQKHPHHDRLERILRILCVSS